MQAKRKNIRNAIELSFCAPANWVHALGTAMTWKGRERKSERESQKRLDITSTFHFFSSFLLWRDYAKTFRKHSEPVKKNRLPPGKSEISATAESYHQPDSVQVSTVSRFLFQINKRTEKKQRTENHVWEISLYSRNSSDTEWRSDWKEYNKRVR